MQSRFDCPACKLSNPLAGRFGRTFTKLRALDTADEILIVGPCDVKLEFVKYMHKNDHVIDPRILGVETLAHLNDSELAGSAKLYFTVGGPLRTGNGSRLST